MEKFHEDPLVQAAFAEVEKHKKLIEANSASNSFYSEEDIITQLKDRVAELEFELNTLNSALSTSFEEVSKLNPDFKKILYKDRLNLADWINTAKASRQVAIDYGKILGKTVSEIRFKIIQERESSLFNLFDPINGTNSIALTDSYKEELLKKIHELLSDKVSDIEKFHNEKYFIKTSPYQNTWFDQIDEWLALALVGDSHAQHNLGVVFYEGITGLNDINEAIKYFKMASSSGVGDSSYMLYKIYSDYQSQYYNDSLSVEYFDLAKNQGSNRLLLDKDKVKKIQLERKKSIIGGYSDKEEKEHKDYLSNILTTREGISLIKNYISSIADKNYSWINQVINAYSVNINYLWKRESIFFSKNKQLLVNVYNKGNTSLRLCIIISLDNGRTEEVELYISPSSKKSLILFKKHSIESSVISVKYRLISEPMEDMITFNYQIN